MSITTDPTTDVGKMRILTGDKYEKALFMNDDEVQVFLDLYDDIRLSAAAMLESMASMEAVIQKKIDHLDLQTDGPAVSEALRNHAERLREQTYNEPAFAVAEQVHDNATYREFVWKEALRRQSG